MSKKRGMILQKQVIKINFSVQTIRIEINLIVFQKWKMRYCPVIAESRQVLSKSTTFWKCLVFKIIARRILVLLVVVLLYLSFVKHQEGSLQNLTQNHLAAHEEMIDADWKGHSFFPTHVNSAGRICPLSNHGRNCET